MTYYWTVLIVLVALFAGVGIAMIIFGYRMMKGVDRARFNRRNEFGVETAENYDTAHRIQVTENMRMGSGRVIFLVGIGSLLLGPFISLLIVSTM